MSIRIAALLGLGALALAACQNRQPSAEAPLLPPALVAAAQKEGDLNVIALPRDWCGYGPLIGRFENAFGIRVNELNPEGGSSDELDGLRSAKAGSLVPTPDVVDIGPAFAEVAKKDGLIQPYKVATWASIPDAAKDAEGFWYGDYFGVLVFETNAAIVKHPPRDWADLTSPELAHAVALPDDPRQSNEATRAVYAAGYATGAHDATGAAKAGLDFFAELRRLGNLVGTGGSATSLADGRAPVVIRWDYLAIPDQVVLAGNPPVDIAVPPSAVIGDYYVQAISAYAAHPNAAKLWMEYLYSDQGQLGFLRGSCHPIRFDALVRGGKIPADIAAHTPPAAAYSHVLFNSLEEKRAAKTIIAHGWAAEVGVDIVR
jgi:putative spermidine/putrescine transport system substrate-binding protein